MLAEFPVFWMLALYMYPPGFVAVNLSSGAFGGVNITSDPFGSTLQLVSRITVLISALTTFSCAVALRPQGDPSLPLTVSVRLPAGSVAPGMSGRITNCVESDGVTEEVFSARQRLR